MSNIQAIANKVQQFLPDVIDEDMNNEQIFNEVENVTSNICSDMGQSTLVEEVMKFLGFPPSSKLSDEMQTRLRNHPEHVQIAMEAQ